MPTGKPEVKGLIKEAPPNIKMELSIKEALGILLERVFKHKDLELWNLVDKIDEALYPRDKDS